MKIKEYDLVKFHQGVYRVMAITSPTTVKISTYGPVHINSVELVEKASIPSLSVGDCVIINDIPKSESSTIFQNRKNLIIRQVGMIK